ncbi:hypothetical protein [Trichormus azollae]|uniref:hypothetical protein n=1 Tax=Trichormus azollae TaxID=1164 RepID=UPI00117FFA7A
MDDNLQPQQVVLGRYSGFTILLILSLSGLFISLILPPTWITLLGLITVAIGISNLVSRETDSLSELPSEIIPFTTHIPHLNK